MKGRFQIQRRIREKCRVWRSAVLAAVLWWAVLFGIFVLEGCGRTEDEAEPALEQEAAEADIRDEEEQSSSADSAVSSGAYQTVVWQGGEYTYNDHLSNFLFLGIDTRENVETDTGMADAGQADALYLLSYDRISGEMVLISIPRDTMTQIEVFDRDGQSLGLTEQHISLSYGYGDGSYGSLALAEQAVSNLFYGLPIQSSCAMSLDGISELLKSFGTVTVTVPNDSLEEEYPEFQEGEEAVITEENAVTLLRWRDAHQAESALGRMERQQAFLKAFGETALERYAGNPEGLLNVYESLSPYLVTEIGSSWLLKIAESYLDGAAVTEWTVPGEGVQGEPFDEYLVDDSAFYEAVIETFYEKAE